MKNLDAVRLIYKEIFFMDIPKGHLDKVLQRNLNFERRPNDVGGLLCVYF